MTLPMDNCRTFAAQEDYCLTLKSNIYVVTHEIHAYPRD